MILLNEIKNQYLTENIFKSGNTLKKKTSKIWNLNYKHTI